jgi:hypothetical protein
MPHDALCGSRLSGRASARNVRLVGLPDPFSGGSVQNGGTRTELWPTSPPYSAGPRSEGRSFHLHPLSTVIGSSTGSNNYTPGRSQSCNSCGCDPMDRPAAVLRGERWRVDAVRKDGMFGDQHSFVAEA